MTQNEHDGIDTLIERFNSLSKRFTELKEEFESFRDWLFKSGIGAGCIWFS